MNEVPSDPWGGNYHYVAGSGYPNGFGIYSAGQDGVSASQGNDEDDLNSWSLDNRGIQADIGHHRFVLALLLGGASILSFMGGVAVSRHRNKAG